MFSLIITIVSIALVVALVAATMYHGGDTLTEGRATADAAAFVSGAQQIGGAAVMYKALEGTAPTSLDNLISNNYLTSVPVVEGADVDPDTAGVQTWRLSDWRVTAAVTSPEVCVAINKSAGAADPTAVEFLGDLPYACVNDGMQFSFKFTSPPIL